jgi:ubiquinone/menaquinone biosynthesis C-methylase UbiE
MSVTEPGTGDLRSRRDRWYGEDSATYDRMVAGQAKYLAALDAPLLDICSGRVLELACGTGRFLAKLLASPAVTEAIGIDLAPQMLAAARVRGLGRLVRAEAERLPFRAASVDAVVCTFYSLRDTDRPLVYAEAARVLRPGGASASPCAISTSATSRRSGGNFFGEAAGRARFRLWTASMAWWTT